MKKVYMLLGAVLMTGLGAQDAMALDAKVLPGMLCTRMSGGIATIDSAGRMTNTGSTSMTVLCPLVRDDTNGILNTLTASMVDQNVSSDGNCRVASVDRSSSSVSWTGKTYTSGNGNTSQSLIRTPVADYNLGSFLLECSIPAVGAANSALVSFYWEED